MATRVLSGTLREIWNEAVPLGAGGSQTITTGIRISSTTLSNVTGVLAAQSNTDTPVLTATPSVSGGFLAITVSNLGPVAATWNLDVSRLHSFQQRRQLSVAGQISVIANGTPQSTLTVVDTIADLRALGDTPAVVNVLGYSAPGDGGGGTFVWRGTWTIPDDGGIIIKPTAVVGAGRWQRETSSWGPAAVENPGVIGEVDVKWFGAKGDGVTDDTASFQTAILAAASHGYAVMLYVPVGIYKITSTLKMKDGVQKLSVRGATMVTLPPEPNNAGTVLLCGSVVGLLFDIWNASGGGTVTTLNHVSADSLKVDGENTTTCTGVFTTVKPSLINTAFASHFSNLEICNIATNGGAALDLSRCFWFLVENCFIHEVINGYGLLISSPYSPTTTGTVRKVFFSRCLEAVAMNVNVLNVLFDSVVFDSVFVALSATYGSYQLTGCYFENVGQLLGGRTTSITTKQGTTDPLTTAIYIVGGNTVVDGCSFAYLTNGTPFDGWCEFVGFNLDPIFNNGGTCHFRGTQRLTSNAAVGQRFFSPATDITTRGDYTIVVDDPVYYAWPDQASGIGYLYADARCITRGRTCIKFADSDVRPISIENGLFEYGFNPDTAYAGGLADAPLGGTNLAGDRVRINTPAAGGYVGFICTAPGDPGTWNGYGAVAP